MKDPSAQSKADDSDANLSVSHFALSISLSDDLAYSKNQALDRGWFRAGEGRILLRYGRNRENRAAAQLPLPAGGGYDIRTFPAGGRIGPSPSSRFAAAPLRFARFAVTAPRRCGEAHPWSLLSEAGPQGRLPAAKTMKTKSLSRAEASRLASETSNPRSGRGLDAEHGSGTADQEDFELRCVNPVGRRGEGVIVRQSRDAISAVSLRIIASPKLPKSSIGNTKAPGPPMTLSW
jgi:hypothetical protein